MVILTNENYKEEVLNYKGKVIVDFWASWCGPCKMIKPKFESLENKYSDYKFCEANVDEATEFADKLKISNVPLFVIFENGNIVTSGKFDKLIEYLDNLN